MLFHNATRKLLKLLEREIMRHKKITYVAVMLLFGGFLGCSSTPNKVSESGFPQTSNQEMTAAQAVNNSVGFDAKAHNFVEIKFRPKSAVLSKNAKQALREVVAQARQDGKTKDVLVFSWSDQEYPSNNLKVLPKREIDIANKRNKAVASYLKSIKNGGVDTYNMAEQPNVFSKWFNTADYKLKKSFLAAGLPTTADAPAYAGKASHTVILVKVE